MDGTYASIDMWTAEQSSSPYKTFLTLIASHVFCTPSQSLNTTSHACRDLAAYRRHAMHLP